VALFHPAEEADIKFILDYEKMVGVGDKCQINAVFCGCMLGDFPPVQL